ncbi:hypothetical protein KI688_011274 [Linnemannia hyalina]|uniref:Uncharacterized protein n=1 Tax=Linnemannia hyalina TaxID=64524 RepID=A0A9P7XW34_9FUNG|nr:hypothetical protein KI688_011274 [Linnemannia hyalina]
MTLDQLIRQTQHLLLLPPIRLLSTVTVPDDRMRPDVIQAIKLDTCYRTAANVYNIGISSARFVNSELFLKRFSSTFNSSPIRNGYDNIWPFQRPYGSDPYNINNFPTVNDNVRSVKIANYETSNTSGHAGNSGEPSELVGCILANN